MRRLAAIAVLAACGHGSSSPPAPVRHETPTTAEAQPAGADDLVVARVDGRPVWGSCVRAQAEALGLDARAALDQCIAFELLAGAADARGLRADPEVGDAWRREMVRALIHRDLGAIGSIHDLPPALTAKALERAHRPPIRFGHYVRAKVPRGAPAGGAADQAARRVADRIYAELGGQEGLLVDDLVAAGERAAAGTGVEIESSIVEGAFATPEEKLPGVRVAVEPFRAALFAIPAIGRVSPPTRVEFKSHSGWDVILLWDEWPAADMTDAFFQEARQRYFAQWSADVARNAGIAPTVDTELFAELYGDEP